MIDKLLFAAGVEVVDKVADKIGNTIKNTGERIENLEDKKFSRLINKDNKSISVDRECKKVYIVEEEITKRGGFGPEKHFRKYTFLNSDQEFIALGTSENTDERIVINIPGIGSVEESRYSYSNQGLLPEYEVKVNGRLGDVAKIRHKGLVFYMKLEDKGWELHFRFGSADKIVNEDGKLVAEVEKKGKNRLLKIKTKTDQNLAIMFIVAGIASRLRDARGTNSYE